MKVLLHIGQSKTGTSAIQAFLTLNRLSLKQQGILYPAIRVSGIEIDLASHNAVADAIAGVSSYPYLPADKYFEQFFSEATKEKCQTLILSAEHFITGHPRAWDVSGYDEYFSIYQEKLQTLAKFLQGHEVHVLVYLRPQVDWVSSAISQTVRIERLASDKRIYYSDSQFFDLYKPLLNYSSILDLWDEILNPASIIAVPYIRDQLIGRSSISDFLHRAGIDNLNYVCKDNGLEINNSITREYIEVKKILNQTPRSKLSERVIIKCLEGLSRKSSWPATYYLDRGLEGEIENFVTNENVRLNNKYLKDELTLKAKGQKGDLIVMPEASSINQAYRTFKIMYYGPIGFSIRINLFLRSFLKRNLRPLHSLLHNIKMHYLRFLFAKK